MDAVQDRDQLEKQDQYQKRCDEIFEKILGVAEEILRTIDTIPHSSLTNYNWYQEKIKIHLKLKTLDDNLDPDTLRDHLMAMERQLESITMHKLSF